MEKLPIPPKESIIYDKDKVYACLAMYPITPGHCVVVWKEKVEDLHLLSRTDYEYLMDTVDMVRNALLKVCNVKKVYLIYMDELCQVHWHLVPRYNEEGFNMLAHNPIETKEFSLAPQLRKVISTTSDPSGIIDL